jgi:hypothetical protein
MPAEILVSITEDWMRRFSDPKRPTPIVAIAHTKNWTDRSMRHLTDYLTWARNAGIRFSTYANWLASLDTDAGADVQPRAALVHRAVSERAASHEIR